MDLPLLRVVGGALTGALTDEEHRREQLVVGGWLQEPPDLVPRCAQHLSDVVGKVLDGRALQRLGLLDERGDLTLGLPPGGMASWT